MQMTTWILAAALFCSQAWAQDSGGKWPKRLWKASIAAVVAGSAVDIQSSFGKRETNGLLANGQGTFSMSGIGLKLALTGAALAGQHYMVHKHPMSAGYKTGALINFAFAGTLAGVAAHNYSVRPSQ